MTDLLPYPEPGGQEFTGGWSGSDASHERALNEARDGTTRERLERALVLVARAGAHGMIVHELTAATGWHHGQSSSALSGLHKLERLAYLPKERRQHCGVYVLPEHVGDRETRPAGRTKANADAYDRGYRDGAREAARNYAEGLMEGRHQATRHVLEVAVRMRGRVDRDPRVNHNPTCWRQHPACALDAVLAAIRVARQ